MIISDADSPDCRAERLLRAAEFIAAKLAELPRVAIILGSGLGSLVDYIEDAVAIDYADIPFWQQTHAAGHSGQLVFGWFDAQPVIAMAGSMGVEHEILSSYPALALDATEPLAALAETVSGHAPLGAVSFGTEAGLFQQAGVPSIICGPGDIARAHRPEEYITRNELEGARAMVLALGRKLSA